MALICPDGGGFILTLGWGGAGDEVDDTLEVKEDFSASFGTLASCGIKNTGTGTTLAGDVDVSLLGSRCATRFGSTTSGSFWLDFLLEVDFSLALK